MSFSRLVQYLSKDGIVPATAVVSLIATSTNKKQLVEQPLMTTFCGVVFGGIGGGIIESVTPLPLRPVVAGGILTLTGLNLAGRSMGYIEEPKPAKLIINQN